MFFAISCFFAIYLSIGIKLFDACLASYFNKEIPQRKISKHQNPIKRADIIDRNGTIIATSLPTVHLYAKPNKIIDAESAARELVNVFPKLGYNRILSILTQKSTFEYIQKNLSPAKQYQVNSLGIPGIYFEDVEKRVYPQKNLFSHLIGKADTDNNGISGIEMAMDERLTHSDISLQLSVDVGIQDTIRMILKQEMDKFKAIGATAILMDVNTSEIISLVSLPDFDPNDNGKIEEKTRFNMATKGVYEPGSVLKIFNTAMSLESGKVKVADSFDATEPFKVNRRLIKDYRGENRWLSVPEILVYSSNIGSARMALKVGSYEQRNFLEKIKFFEPLDIELVEKGKPLVPSRWSDVTTATVAYGYGLAVSPLHVISAYSAVINGGIYHNPTLIKDSQKTKNGYRVISHNTSKAMRKLMRLVVTEGSGKKANVAGYEVGGKTGTAEKLSAGGSYVDRKVRTTFVSAFPISDPKYALLVMMDEPKATKDTFGYVTSGWNSVPTASKIISAIAPQLNLKANFDLDEMRQQRIIEASYQR